MTITKLKPKANVEAFISGAPDAGAAEDKPKTKHVKKGNRIQITHTLPLELLERADAMAERLGQKRAGFINLAITQMLERGASLGGEAN